MSTILTPNGALPLKAARAAEPGKLWSVDGRRQVPIDSVPGAWELNLYCIRAYYFADLAAWYEQGPANGAPELGDLRRLARLDKLQAIRTLAVLLPLMADVYEWQGMPTSSSSHQYGDISLAHIRDPEGRVLRTFREPEDWRVWGRQLEREYLEPAGISLLEPGGAYGLPALPAVAWVAISLVGAAIVATAVAWSVGRVTDYASQELEVLEGRVACFDRWAEEYAQTGSEQARQAMLACHEQVETIGARKGLSSLLWPLAALAGIVAVGALSD